MNQRDIVWGFVNGDEPPQRQQSSVTHKSGVLYSYNTPIAIHLGGKQIAMNLVNYSVTTKKMQNWLKKDLEDAGYQPNGQFHEVREVFGGPRLPKHMQIWEINNGETA